MLGTGPNPGGGTGSSSTGHDASRFYERLRARLTGRGYSEVVVTPQMAPLQLAFLWQGTAFHAPRSIGVVNLGTAAAPPLQIYEQIKHWFQSTHPRQGGPGLLLFVCYDPSAAFVDDVKKSAQYAGNVRVDLCAYDLRHDRHWESGATECVGDVFEL